MVQVAHLAVVEAVEEAVIVVVLLDIQHMDMEVEAVEVELELRLQITQVAMVPLV